MNVVSIPVPLWTLIYCEQLAGVFYSGEQNRMHLHMVDMFIAAAPWKAKPGSLKWKQIDIQDADATYSDILSGVDENWGLMNMSLSDETLDKIDSIIETQKIKRDTFLNTVVSWWCTYVYPYENKVVDTK